MRHTVSTFTPAVQREVLLIKEEGNTFNDDTDVSCVGTVFMNKVANIYLILMSIYIKLSQEKGLNLTTTDSKNLHFILG